MTVTDAAADCLLALPDQAPRTKDEAGVLLGCTVTPFLGPAVVDGPNSGAASLVEAVSACLHAFMQLSYPSLPAPPQCTHSKHAFTVQDKAILRCSNCFAYINPYCEVRNRWYRLSPRMTLS